MALRLDLNPSDDRIDEAYRQERYQAEQDDLDRWWSQQLTPPEPPEGGIPSIPVSAVPGASSETGLPLPHPPAGGIPPVPVSAVPGGPPATTPPTTLGTPQPQEGPQGATEKTAQVLSEVGRVVGGGVLDAFQKTIKGAEDLSLMAGEQWFRLLGQRQDAERFSAALEGEQPTDRASEMVPTIEKSESTPLNLARGLVRTATEVAAFGSMLRGSGVVGRLAPVALDAMVDFFGQDPDEGRLTDLVLTLAPELVDTPILGEVVGFLKTDPTDSNALGRFKNVIEGQITGRVLDVAMHPRETAQLITDGFDALRQSKTLPAIAEETKRLLKEESGEVRLPGGDDAPAPRPQVEEAQAAQQLMTGEGMEETASRVNMARLSAEERTKTVLETVNKLNVESGATETAVRGVVSHEATEAAAKGKVTAEMLLARQPGEMIAGIPLNEQITAARKLRVSSAKNLGALAKRTVNGDTEAADLLYDALAVHGKIDEAVTGMSAEVGRALEAHKIMAGAEGFDPRQLGELADRLKGVSRESQGPGVPVVVSPQRLAEMIMAAEKVAGRIGVDTMARQAVKHPYANALLEAWINGLLSGPQTHAANALSNSITTFWAIPERILAARMHPLTHTGVMKGEATQMLYGLVNGFSDALSLSAKSFVAGTPATGLSKFEYHPAITAEALNISGIPGRAVDVLGNVVRIPGRFLMAGDEFFKGINYRMELHAQAFRQASLEGLDGTAMASRIQQIINDPPASIKEAAEGFAAYQTFTNELGESGQAFIGFANSHPAIRVVLPFIRTPTNIFKYAMERTPLLNLVSSAVRADLKAGGVKRDMALAKMSLGAMTMGTVAALAASDLITGGGPSDPALLRMKRQTGWQPYSIKVGDTYYSYNRLDPVGMLLGMVANMVEIGGELPSADFDQLVMAGLLSTMEALTSKTYLQGLSDLLEAIRDPERGGTNYLRGLARSIVPAGVAQVNRAMIDPQMREVNSLLDQMRARVPGYSSELPVRRNLWGEPILLEGGLGPDVISPIYRSEVKDDPVTDEIVRLRIGLSMPSKYIGGSRPPESPFSEERASHGVELTPEEYDLYVRLAGNELKGPGGRGLHDHLADLITTPKYQEQSDGQDGGKAFLIKQAVQTYRQAAQVELRRRSPELNDLIVQQQRRRIEQRIPDPERSGALGIAR